MELSLPKGSKSLSLIDLIMLKKIPEGSHLLKSNETPHADRRKTGFVAYWRGSISVEAQVCLIKIIKLPTSLVICLNPKSPDDKEIEQCYIVYRSMSDWNSTNAVFSEER